MFDHAVDSIARQQQHVTVGEDMLTSVYFHEVVRSNGLRQDMPHGMRLGLRFRQSARPDEIAHPGVVDGELRQFAISQ